MHELVFANAPFMFSINLSTAFIAANPETKSEIKSIRKAWDSAIEILSDEELEYNRGALTSLFDWIKVNPGIIDTDRWWNSLNEQTKAQLAPMDYSPEFIDRMVRYPDTRQMLAIFFTIKGPYQPCCVGEFSNRFYVRTTRWTDRLKNTYTEIISGLRESTRNQIAYWY